MASTREEGVAPSYSRVLFERQKDPINSKSVPKDSSQSENNAFESIKGKKPEENPQTPNREACGKRCKNLLNANCCIPKAKEDPKYKITSVKIGEYIQFMQDHSFIVKFMEIWPMEKALISWIMTN
jgi:hypothetical protein